jgi:hypothetical protein
LSDDAIGDGRDGQTPGPPGKFAEKDPTKREKAVLAFLKLIKDLPQMGVGLKGETV